MGGRKWRVQIPPPPLLSEQIEKVINMHEFGCDGDGL